MTDKFLHGIEVIEISDGARPIETVRSSVIGLIGTAPDADEDIFPLNHPVLIAGSPRKAAKLGDSGTLKDAIDGVFDQSGAMVIIVRVEEGSDEAATLSNIVGDGTVNTGVHAFLNAESIVHAAPRILIAPGFTSARPDGNKNPVVAELVGIAQRMRAIILADGPNTTIEEAIAYSKDYGSDRVYIIDPYAMVWDTNSDMAVAKPASSRVAGRIAHTDQNKGFWWSPSNQNINGIVGVSRPVGFQLSDANSEANFLNENNVATIIHRDGYRLWGNRTPSSDPLWQFLSVRRTADMIYDSIEEAFLWAMDKPIVANTILEILESVRAYLRHLKAMGAILDGDAWIDPELNTVEQLRLGKLSIDFDIEPPAPLEHLTFRAHRNGEYYEEMVQKVAQSA